MTLEEIERLASAALASRPAPTTNAAPIVELARFVIAAVPVVRAAEKWRSVDSCQTEPNYPGVCRCDECKAANAVCGALDDMQDAMEEK